ncbi:transcription factor grauzone-like [Lutzomyia longipalpis]|uniref:transcription factor grauzone-like n=1 Tax=Lutzomyia longipalpis TaxID=7200 RepID=UPI0024839AAF|nr:transcription factor grauzone-like [Lutzomyia longipalpis]
MEHTEIKEEETFSISSSNICRICLIEGSTYFNVFAEDYTGPEIIDTVRNLIGISISPLDNWPKNFCISCIETIQKFQSLLTKVQQNEGRLIDAFGAYQLHDDEQKSDITFTAIPTNPEFISTEVKEECSPIDPIEGGFSDTCEDTLDVKDDPPVAKPKKRGRKPRKLLENPSNVPAKKTEKVKQPTDKATDDRISAAVQEFYKMDCILCNIPFPTFADVQAHFRNEHNGRGYIVCCGKKLNSPKKLQDHMNNHINPVRHQCSECLKFYKTEYSLITHKRLQHTPIEERQYCCDKCPKRFALVGALTAHMLVHIAPEQKKHICETCGQAFALKTILVQHVRRVHENACVSVCDICAKVFRTKSLFEKHVLEHSTMIKPTIPCTVCGKMFKHRIAMRKHMRRHNTSGSLACSFCTHVSANQQALSEHIKYNHTKRKTFQCSLCEGIFRSRVSLKEHMASHTGQVLYECRYCSKQFNSNANYFRHIKVSHPVEWEAEKQKKMAKDVFVKPETKSE